MLSATERNARAYDRHAREWAARIEDDAGHKYLEKPAMEMELPGDLSGRDVLCIGVGAGAELPRLLAFRPARVAAIDVSRALLAIASARYPSVGFACMDMLSLAFRGATFDFVYSSLAFHYAHDWDRLLDGVSRVLRPGGTLLFSTHHPDYWSRKTPTGNTFTNSRGVTLSEHVATLPAADVEIVYYNHRDESAIADALGHAGFTVHALVAPSVASLSDARYAALSPDERERYEEIRAKNTPQPLFLVARATK